MKVVRLECGNGDSCSPGTSHLYPAVNEHVTLLVGQGLHEVGQEVDVDFPAGATFEVVNIDPEPHYVMGATRGSYFWVPIDDIDWPERSEIEEEEE